MTAAVIPLYPRNTRELQLQRQNAHLRAQVDSLLGELDEARAVTLRPVEVVRADPYTLLMAALGGFLAGLGAAVAIVAVRGGL